MHDPEAVTTYGTVRAREFHSPPISFICTIFRCRWLIGVTLNLNSTENCLSLPSISDYRLTSCILTPGTVFWALDGVNKELVRYDFSQPHGPGFMDHSVAQVRRYVEVTFSQPQVRSQHASILPNTRHQLVMCWKQMIWARSYDLQFRDTSGLQPSVDHKLRG